MLDQSEPSSREFVPALYPGLYGPPSASLMSWMSMTPSTPSARRTRKLAYRHVLAARFLHTEPNAGAASAWLTPRDNLDHLPRALGIIVGMCRRSIWGNLGLVRTSSYAIVGNGFVSVVGTSGARLASSGPAHWRLWAAASTATSGSLGQARPPRGNLDHPTRAPGIIVGSCAAMCRWLPWGTLCHVWSNPHGIVG